MKELGRRDRGKGLGLSPLLGSLCFDWIGGFLFRGGESGLSLSLCPASSWAWKKSLPCLGSLLLSFKTSSISTPLPLHLFILLCPSTTSLFSNSTTTATKTTTGLLFLRLLLCMSLDLLHFSIIFCLVVFTVLIGDLNLNCLILPFFFCLASDFLGF